MPLEVYPITEPDFETFVRISFSGFNNGMASKLHPRPATPEYIQKSIAKHVKSWKNEPDVHYVKVVDTDLGGKMIAGAKWRINEKERTEEEYEIQIPKPGKDEEGNEAAKDFMGYLADARRTWMGGKPFYFLHILVTDPEHQRRGAGALLVNWGTAQADKAGLPAFLESTDAGKPLYSKLGFEVKQAQRFDLSKYGGEGIEYNTVMIRSPKS